jgi:hypothetical protein
LLLPQPDSGKSSRLPSITPRHDLSALRLVVRKKNEAISVSLLGCLTRGDLK